MGVDEPGREVFLVEHAQEVKQSQNQEEVHAAEEMPNQRDNHPNDLRFPRLLQVDDIFDTGRDHSRLDLATPARVQLEVGLRPFCRRSDLVLAWAQGRFLESVVEVVHAHLSHDETVS